MLKLGAVLRSMRHRAGFSQEEIAFQLNISQSTVSKIEKDRKLPDLPLLIRWADVTNAKEVIVAYLCGLDGITIMQSILQMFGG